MDTLAPDTVRDRDRTAPLDEPLRVVTVPLATPVRKRVTVTYDVYTPDDTLRAKKTLQLEVDREARSQRIGLAALGLALAIVTTLAAAGSCEETREGTVETTSASVPAPHASSALPPQVTPVPPAVPETATVTPLVPLTASATPMTFSPPLSPPPPPPLRRRVPRPLTKR